MHKKLIERLKKQGSNFMVRTFLSDLTEDIIMGIFEEIVIQVTILILIIGAVHLVSYERTTKSKKRFTIKIPRAFVRIMGFVSTLPAICGLVLFIVFRDRIVFGFYVFMFALSVSVLLFLLIVTLIKIDVEGDIIKYRSCIGWKKSIGFEQVEKVVFTKYFMIIYANGKRFGSVSRNF